MTVKELIDVLSKTDLDKRVVVVTDSELTYPIDIEDVIDMSGMNYGYVILSTELKLGE